MMKQMTIFDNREIAIATWIGILIALGATKPSMRRAFVDFVTSMLKKAILLSLVLMIAYIALIVYGLHAVGLWDGSQFKNTVIWSASVGTMSLFHITHIMKDQHYYKYVITDNLKLVVVLEFIISFYTFPLWLELVVVPVATIAVAMQVYAHGKNDFALAAKFFDVVLGLFGLILFSYAGYELITNFREFAKLETLTEFFIPLILSCSFLPFILFLGIWCNYEMVFVRLNFAIQDSSLRAYAKRRAIFGFHFRTEILKRWARNLMVVRPADKHNINESISEVKIHRARENYPAYVPFGRGWSPYIARQFLISEGLYPSDYHRVVDGTDEWFASSPYVEIGEGVVPENIAYYVEGNEYTATTLKLVMNVNQPWTSQGARMKFINVVRLLIVKALHTEMPKDIEEDLSSEIDMTLNLQKKEVLVTKKPWPGHRLGGYSLNFIIRNAAMSQPGGSG